MSYLSLTERDREEMLAAIGVSSVEELFRDIPAGVRFARDLDLEPPLSEQELSRHLEELAAQNVDTSKELSFLGAGIYDHYVPAVVDTTAVGAALVAATAIGYFSSLRAGSSAWVRPGPAMLPEEPGLSIYADAYRRFINLGTALATASRKEP